LGRSQKTENLTGTRAEFWGLTGGIASGKSTAAKFFSELGVPVVDADEISRALSGLGGAAHAEVIKRFGTADREKLREIVFKDPTSRSDLEKILHPHIIRESQIAMEALALKTGCPAVIYEATLLVETGRYKSLAGLIVIESPRETRKKRLISRNGFSDAMAEQILNSQISDEKRRKAATTVIQNAGSLDDLRAKVHEFSLARGWIVS